MVSLLVVALLGAAGGLGAVARYTLAEWMARRWRGVFPLATLVINVTGAFALGVLLTMGLGGAQMTLRAVVGTGFLGGYTTFSALSLETLTLTRRGHSTLAWLNTLGSLAVGLLAVVAGIGIGRLL